MDKQGSNNYNNHPKDNDGKKNRNGQMITAFIMVTLVALFLVSFFTSKFAQMSSRETSYTEFIEQFKKGNVKSVEFDNYEIDYKLVKDKTKYEITYYKLEVDGKVIFEIDKFNSICIMNGVDILADMKKFL